MKLAKTLLLSACVAMSGAAFAQAGGGNGNGGAGAGNAHGAATAGPTTGQAAGGEPASGATSSSTMQKHHMSKSKSKAKHPMTDSTNMPGADASSDTKGQ